MDRLDGVIIESYPTPDQGAPPSVDGAGNVIEIPLYPGYYLGSKHSPEASCNEDEYAWHRLPGMDDYLQHRETDVDTLPSKGLGPLSKLPCNVGYRILNLVMRVDRNIGLNHINLLTPYQRITGRDASQWVSFRHHASWSDASHSIGKIENQLGVLHRWTELMQQILTLNFNAVRKKHSSMLNLALVSRQMFSIVSSLWGDYLSRQCEHIQKWGRSMGLWSAYHKRRVGQQPDSVQAKKDWLRFEYAEILSKILLKMMNNFVIEGNWK